jgi:hypothetical protein
MKRLNVSQEELARRIREDGRDTAGCNRAMVDRWLRGITKCPQPRYLRALERVTGLPAAILGYPAGRNHEIEADADELDRVFEQAPEAVRARFYLLTQDALQARGVPQQEAVHVRGTELANAHEADRVGLLPAGRVVPPLADINARFLALTGAATIGALGDTVLASLSDRGQAPDSPARIGHVDVADLHHVIDGMERADHAAGGRTVVRSLAVSQLDWARETLRTASFLKPSARTAWMGAVARLGRLAGFMSVDARDHDEARRCFLIALQIAADAEDWPNRLNVLSGMARQAVHLGDGGTALKISTLARAGEASASPTTRAMMRVLEARAYGVLGRAGEAMSAVRQAEELFAHPHRRPEDDPPWLWFYDDAQLHGDTGHALFPLALAGVEVDAVRRLRLAVEEHSTADTRGRTFSLIKLATLEVRQSPGSQAYRRAQEAITATAGLRSGRALDYLSDLRRVLRDTETDEARSLASQVSTTLSAIQPG